MKWALSLVNDKHRWLTRFMMLYYMVYGSRCIPLKLNHIHVSGVSVLALLTFINRSWTSEWNMNALFVLTWGPFPSGTRDTYARVHRFWSRCLHTGGSRIFLKGRCTYSWLFSTIKSILQLSLKFLVWGMIIISSQRFITDLIRLTYFYTAI